MNNKSTYLILGILAAVLAVSVPLYLVVPKAGQEALVARFPMQLAGWTGEDIPVDDNAYAILETKNLILREYTRGQDRVYLYIIYSQDNRKVSHPPEVCLEGSGVTVVKKDKAPLMLADDKKILANRLLVEKAGAKNVTLYWYKAGQQYTDNYLVQQLRVASNQLRFKPASSALIRVSADVRADDADQTYRKLQEFVKDSSRYFEEIMP